MRDERQILADPRRQRVGGQPGIDSVGVLATSSVPVVVNERLNVTPQTEKVLVGHASGWVPHVGSPEAGLNVVVGEVVGTGMLKRPLSLAPRTVVWLYEVAVTDTGVKLGATALAFPHPEVNRVNYRFIPRLSHRGIEERNSPLISDYWLRRTTKLNPVIK
jgi:hypothetical protein